MIELLWWRAAYGKNFETPEARAALEKQLKQQIFTIKDENIRRYYLQDIRKRLFDFFRSSFSKKKVRGDTTSFPKIRYLKTNLFLFWQTPI